MNKWGFTLVELIVTITIVALLSTVGFMSFSGYISASKDSMRITQIATLSDTLEVHKLKKALPLPDSYVQVKDGTELIAYQGYAGDSVLSSIGIEKKGGDFKEGIFYSYYVTKSRRSFQLMTFLENGEEMNTISFTPTTFADSEDFTYPYIAGHTLGILTDVNNTPIQEIEAIKVSHFDIASVTEEYIIHLSNEEKLQGSTDVLQNIKIMSLAGGKFCKIDGDSVLCDDPNISQYQKYPDCPAGTINSETNDSIYNYGFVNNSIYINVTGVEVLQAETNSYATVMYCDKGTGVISGVEELIGTVCNQGYTWNGVECEVPDLYAFTSHTFTNCNTNGKNGPTLSDCRSAYTASWDSDDAFYNQVTGSQGYQLWTVPTTATYTIDAYGGSSEGRKGTRTQGDFSLVKGEQLIIVVGQKGTRGGHGEGGAGGTFVVKANSIPALVSSITPLIIAGGAGGRGDDGSCSNTDAHYLTTAGKSSCNSKAGGTNGSDGTTSYGGKGSNSFSNLIGKNDEDGGEGGFGGGGGDQDSGDNGGGGGGYSGGGGAGGGDKRGGGGGGSYNAGTNQIQGLAPSVSAHGYVTITKN